jgi:hypothetical protein
MFYVDKYSFVQNNLRIVPAGGGVMEDDWNRRAANFLKGELARAGVSYEELCQRLSAIGVREKYKGLASKINRGAFTFAFFMQCMKVLGKTTVRLDND